MDKFFTVNELADHFEINPKTIYRRLWAKVYSCLQGRKSVEDSKEGYRLVEAIISQE